MLPATDKAREDEFEVILADRLKYLFEEQDDDVDAGVCLYLRSVFWFLYGPILQGGTVADVRDVTQLILAAVKSAETATVSGIRRRADA